MRIIKIILSILALCIIIYNISSVIYLNKSKYLAHDYWQNFPQLRHTYFNSQYANKNPIWIVDEVGFSYAGGALIRGESPVLVIPDAPPLGKYLIGVSIVIFNNPHIIIAIFGIISLLLLYVFGVQILGDKFLALLPVLFFSSEPIFKNQLIFTPLMDLFQLVFILSYFIIFNNAALAKKNSMLSFILASIFLGLFISTKFFVSGLTIVGASIIFLFLNKKNKKMIAYVLSLSISLGILLFSYARVFAFGYNFREFLGIQKWVFDYHNGQLILPFSVWPLLFFNQWYVWFGDKPVIHDSQWLITWPIITILSFIAILIYLFKKIPRKKEVETAMIWSVLYLIFLSSGLIFSRYFVILIPILYVISLYGVLSIIKKYIKINK